MEGCFRSPHGTRSRERARQVGSLNVLVIDVVARTVVGARVSHAKGALERDGNPGEIGALGIGPGPGKRAGKEFFGQEDRVLDGAVRVRSAALLNKVVGAIDLVVPGAAVPVVVTGKVQEARALDVESDVEVVGLLVEKVAGVSGVVVTGAVGGAADGGSHAAA